MTLDEQLKKHLEDCKNGDHCHCMVDGYECCWCEAS